MNNVLAIPGQGLRRGSMRGDNIKYTWNHDAGAHGQCSYCGRYSDNSFILTHFIECECGEKDGWSGSFPPPTEDSKWSDTGISV
jgi:hypothetical protein